MRSTIPKPEHGSIDWLRARHRDENGSPIISASEAAVVHGEHRFTSRYQLAVEKMAGEPAVTETSEAMERGNRLEPVLIDWVADRLGCSLITPDVMYRHSENGVTMSATLDAVAGDMLNPDTVVEIKTYNRVFDPDSNLHGYGPLPAYWHWQGVQQAICSGCSEIVWGVFDSSLRLHIWRQQVSSLDELEHRNAVFNFVRTVRAGNIPAEWAEKYDDVKHLAAEPGKVCDMDDVRSQIGELGEVQAELKLLKAREDRLKAIICAELGDATSGLLDGEEVVTWKPQSKKSFDTKRFEADHGDLYRTYLTESTFRVLRSKS